MAFVKSTGGQIRCRHVAGAFCCLITPGFPLASKRLLRAEVVKSEASHAGRRGSTYFVKGP